MLHEAGISYEDYSGHSFRIRVATVVARASWNTGFHHSGPCWVEQCDTYVLHQNPRSQLAQFSRELTVTVELDNAYRCYLMHNTANLDGY